MSDKAKYYRVQITMSSDMDRYLDSLGRAAKQTGGFKVPKTEVVRAMIRAFRKLGVDVSGVTSEIELEHRIMDAVKEYRAGKQARKSAK